MRPSEDSGLYQLIIGLPSGGNIRVGRHGVFRFPAGVYVYTGSAKASLEARILRHVRKEKRVRWHIDYLLRHAEILEVKRYNGRLSECELNLKVEKLHGSRAVVRGFGSSDCSCNAHLFYFDRNPSKELRICKEPREVTNPRGIVS